MLNRRVRTAVPGWFRRTPPRCRALGERSDDQGVALAQSCAGSTKSLTLPGSSWALGWSGALVVAGGLLGNFPLPFGGPESTHESEHQVGHSGRVTAATDEIFPSAPA